MDALSIDAARLLSLAVGMRDLLAQLAAGEECPAAYRRPAAELVELWARSAPRVIVGEHPPTPAIVLLPLADDQAGAAMTSVKSPAIRPPRLGRIAQADLSKVTGELEHNGPCSARELAAATGLSRTRVYYVLRLGRFTAHKGPPRTRFSLPALESAAAS